MNQTVFYIWQSDLPNRTNRGLIETALEGAIDAILDDELELEPVIDRDTVGLPGAPDIARAILAKIDAATVVVADVSIINSGVSPPPSRLAPNPNVMFELGYAAARHGWDSIVLVHNLATGRIEDLPFDIRQRRPITYAAAGDNGDLAPTRRSLQRALQRAVTACLHGSARREPNVSLVYRPSPGRFGLRNSGSSRVRVDRVVYRFPQSIHVNQGPPFAPVRSVTVTELGAVDGVQWYELRLDHLAGEPREATLPEFVAAGDTEIFTALPSFIKRDAAPETKVYVKLYFSDDSSIEVEPTVGELHDARGPYAE